MNAQEKTIWHEFLGEHKKAIEAFKMVDLYRANMAIVLSHALEYGLIKTKSELEKANYDDRYNLLKSKLVNMELWRKWLDGKELGLTLRAGDFDIVAPLGTNSDRLALYKNPGFGGFPLIIAGIVVVASIIAYVVLIWSELSRLGDDYDRLIKTTDSKFCADPGSAVCSAWLAKKESSDFHKNESMIDTIKRKLSSAIETVGKGLGKGLIVAVPLLLLFFAVKGQKR